MRFTGLGVSDVWPRRFLHRLRFERQHVINPQARVQARFYRQRIDWHHCRQYQLENIIFNPSTTHLLAPALQSRFCQLVLFYTTYGCLSTTVGCVTRCDTLSGCGGSGGMGGQASPHIGGKPPARCSCRFLVESGARQGSRSRPLLTIFYWPVPRSERDLPQAVAVSAESARVSHKRAY